MAQADTAVIVGKPAPQPGIEEVVAKAQINVKGDGFEADIHRVQGFLASELTVASHEPGLAVREDPRDDAPHEPGGSGHRGLDRNAIQYFALP